MRLLRLAQQNYKMDKISHLGTVFSFDITLNRAGRHDNSFQGGMRHQRARICLSEEVTLFLLFDA